MPTAAHSGPALPRAARAPHRTAPALPPSTANKRPRPPTADSSPLANSPLSRHPSEVIVTNGPQKSPTKRSRTAGATHPAVPSTPPGRDTIHATPPTPSKTSTTRDIPPTIPPVTTNVPEDVARICGIRDSHADALTTALSIVYEADDRVGAVVDTILQKLFYTVTSYALRAATTPPPATADTPALATATGPLPTYASKLTTQTTPLRQQTNDRHGNANTPATRPPPREEVILHTSRITSPPSCETIVNAVRTAAGDRVPALAVRQLPSGDSAVVFPGGTDRWYVKDVSWADALGAEVTITGPRVVLHNVPAATLHQDLRNKLNTPCPVLQTRPMIRTDGTPANHGSLCLTVATDADAALLIRNGVIIDYCLYRAVPYKPDTRPQICHRCQTWEHPARGCRKPLRCAYCGGAHGSPSCDKPLDERHCPNCREPHPAYSRACLFYQTTFTGLQAANGAGRRPPPARPDNTSATHTPQPPPMTL